MPTLIPPHSYICYYGPGQLEKLARADWVIVQAGHYTPNDLAWLKAHQTMPFAYLSVGEETAEGGAKPWHLRTEDSLLATNTAWDTHYVDCRSAAWQAHLLEEVVPQLQAHGFAGLLLDTLDVAEKFPTTRPGVLQLLQQLRAHFPHLYFIANRGFSLLDELVPLVDAFLFESFSTYHAGVVCRPWPPQDQAWLTLQAARLWATGLPVLALDYANPGQPELMTYAHGRAQEAHFIPYVTNWSLDWLNTMSDE